MSEKSELYIIKTKFKAEVEQFYLKEYSERTCCACGEETLWSAQTDAYLKGYKDALEQTRISLDKIRLESIL